MTLLPGPALRLSATSAPVGELVALQSGFLGEGLDGEVSVRTQGDADRSGAGAGVPPPPSQNCCHSAATHAPCTATRPPATHGPYTERQVVGDGDLFALTVVGDSMIDAAICDGDIVTVRKVDSADDGDIVAALLDDEATVKMLRRQDGQVWLMPRNPAYEPIPGDDAQILGKVVGVLRLR
ncbi:LexA family protein [Streptomyces sp. NPDC059340]|uniref:LexA family protein n=1 Tax=Streptomyces sp. NPDC059340 TaxID=3346806 RepID=UPI003678F551